jgi:transglutaminase superfamily protein
MSPGAAWLGARMLAWRIALPLLKRALPLAALARLAWPRRRSRRRRPDREALVAGVVSRLYGTARRDDNCLERSVLAYRFLAQAGAEPRLTCGIRRANGDVVGHAWIVLDGRPLASADEGIEDYTLVTAFGAGGARLA